ncbi:MAG TPA: hypothetical protein VH370_08005 [Humisphaera sp.]|jgi:hypothetical protein|nr:hypothetical protein [Humisphaera sp.]
MPRIVRYAPTIISVPPGDGWTTLIDDSTASTAINTLSVRVDAPADAMVDLQLQGNWFSGEALMVARDRDGLLQSLMAHSEPPGSVMAKIYALPIRPGCFALFGITELWLFRYVLQARLLPVRQGDTLVGSRNVSVQGAAVLNQVF